MQFVINDLLTLQGTGEIIKGAVLDDSSINVIILIPQSERKSVS